MKVLVIDSMMAQREAKLRAWVKTPVEWTFAPGASEAKLIQLLVEAEVLVGSNFTPAMAQAAGKLRLLQSTGAGVDHLDFQAMPAGLIVANTFHHERAMAEHTLMVMLALSRRLFHADANLRQGVWDNAYSQPGARLHRTLRGQLAGIVGFGHIGREVARLCRCLDMRVMAVARRPDPGLAAEYGLEHLGSQADLPDLLQQSDFVIVAAPLTGETRGLIGRDELALMRPEAYLVNVARGPLVEEAALFEALRQRKIAGAALDVWYIYPEDERPTLPASHPFHELDNVILTPHHSGVAEETFDGRAHDVAENINRLAGGRPLINVVFPSPKGHDQSM
jgi:phosphoglycerate dehydrogenase-like enzyme